MIRPGELNAAEMAIWAGIQNDDPALSSPCLSPHFTCAIATLRDDIFVGVIENGNRPVGFFPFQRDGNGGAASCMERMADYEAVIVKPGAAWTIGDLLRGCRLTSWNFRALVGGNEQLQPFHAATSFSLRIDLSGGFQPWLEAIRRRGSRLRKHLQTQRRALERDMGEVRFEGRNSSAEALSWLRNCKSSQYLRTGKPDHFRKPWVAALVEQVQLTDDENFKGSLSVLRAGGRIVAAHLGMSSHTVWHYWLPCYDRALARYSPGSLLLMEMACSAEQCGILYIDLGPGSEDYKSRFANKKISIAAGTVSICRPAAV